jgi:hypothetical protein
MICDKNFVVDGRSVSIVLQKVASLQHWNIMDLTAG